MICMMQKKAAFKVVVMSKIFTAETAPDGIPAMWDEYYQGGFHQVVPGMFGICIAAPEGMKYAIGSLEKDAKEVPAGFEVLEIPSLLWGMFQCEGPVPEAIQETWSKIYGEWLPQVNYEILPHYGIEVYSEGDHRDPDYVSQVWVPVQPKTNMA